MICGAGWGLAGSWSWEEEGEALTTLPSRPFPGVARELIDEFAREVIGRV
jgi:hypothetical protein